MVWIKSGRRRAKMTEVEKINLTSLMKEKYGVTRSSPIKFTENDTLYTTFRKLADNIYKNGEWTKEEEVRAVDTLIRNRRGFSLGMEDIVIHHSSGKSWQATIRIEPMSSVDKQILGTRAEGKIGYTALVEQVEEISQKKIHEKHLFFWILKIRWGQSMGNSIITMKMK